MTQVFLIFPHQLFEKILAPKGASCYLIEDDLFFKQYPFHKQKLVLHRASMNYYKEYLEKHGYSVYYVESRGYKGIEHFLETLKKEKSPEGISYVETDDYLLERRIARYSKKLDLKTFQIPNPNFLTGMPKMEEMLTKRKSYFLNSFYKDQRVRLGILLNKDGSPRGGEWNYDTENRKKLPDNEQVPYPKTYGNNKYVKKAVAYVEKHFPNNYGELDNFVWPTTHQEAREALENFLEKRFYKYGTYQDAIRPKDTFLFHALLTAPFNVGLLEPREIVEKALAFAEENSIEINHTEGFIRQIIGWREFMRGLYRLEGNQMRNKNFFGFTRKIPASFWKGTTGIDPIDITIKKLHHYAYNHHIERLMVMGNFMLLCEFDPDEVYEWFMHWYIDAYDWVMVPNVYGMSQYADGGLITTKPYISSSNYIKKMSTYKKGDWEKKWDGLYWCFIKTHGELFKKNQRMSMQFSLLNRMKKETLHGHLKAADDFLSKL